MIDETEAKERRAACWLILTTGMRALRHTNQASAHSLGGAFDLISELLDKSGNGNSMPAEAEAVLIVDRDVEEITFYKLTGTGKPLTVFEELAFKNWIAEMHDIVRANEKQLLQ